MDDKTIFEISIKITVKLKRNESIFETKSKVKCIMYRTYCIHNYLCSQCAYDVARGGLASVYHLMRIRYDIDQREEVCIKVIATRITPKISSVFWVWKSTDFPERESYDMLGISYDNHPRLKCILMPESWVG